MSTTIALEAEQYNDFIRCLTNLKDVCNDVDIRNGFIRQRTNGNVSIFEIDISTIVQDASFAIIDLKQKLDLLKTFQGQDINIEIEESVPGSVGYFTFSDQFSSLRIVLPTPEFVDNKFMSEEELRSIFNSSDDDLIFEYDIPQLITERVSVITSSFNVKSIRVDFDGDTARISSATQSKDQLATFASGLETNMEMEQSSAYITVIPFSIDHDSDIEFKMYKDPNQDVTLNNFSTQLGDIDINIFTRASIIRDED
jgi:hypothetical protein